MPKVWDILAAAHRQDIRGNDMTDRRRRSAIGHRWLSNPLSVEGLTTSG